MGSSLLAVIPSSLYLVVCVKTFQVEGKLELYFRSHLPNLQVLLARPMQYKPGHRKGLWYQAFLHWLLRPFLLGGKLASVWPRVPWSSVHRGPIVLTLCKSNEMR